MSGWTSLAYVDLEQVVIRLLAAAGLAAVIGLDREVRNKPIGIRTCMLVGLGAASFSVIVMELLYSVEGTDSLAMDPSRVIEGIIGGIGFLGAGAIIQGHRAVVGATTGASIWVVGAIGVACGFGFFVHAVVATVIASLVLTGLGLVEHWLGGKPGQGDAKAP